MFRPNTLLGTTVATLFERLSRINVVLGELKLMPTDAREVDLVYLRGVQSRLIADVKKPSKSQKELVDLIETLFTTNTQEEESSE